MHTTYTHCNITGCSCNQSLTQSQIQHPQPPTNNPASTISQPPQQISQSQTTSPPQKISRSEAIAQGQAMSNAQKGPQGNPQAQANPPPQSPSPPKRANESPNPKKPPLPKKSLMPKKEPKETPTTEETERPHSALQKEIIMITNPLAEIKEERVEPRCGNCKRRILHTDDSDDEIGNINENEPGTKKKVEMRSFVTCFGL